MSLQPLFWIVAIGAWTVGFVAGTIGFYRRLTGRRQGKTTLFFFCGLAVFAATVSLARWLGYWL